MSPVVLRERITLIGVQLKETPEGTYQETARNLTAVWADIRALPASTPPVLYRVRIRYQPIEFQRIRWRKKTYSLAVSIIVDPTRQWLDFTIREKLYGGGIS